MSKIFYSWQSDDSSTRNYLKSRLEEAASSVGNFEIVTATSNERGAGDIAGAIFEKIDGCDLFLADVSIINPRSRTRKCPNPNVMYELGYAIAKKGKDNVVLIANQVTTNTAHLPFDVRNRRMILTRFDAANKVPITQTIAQIMSSFASTSPSAAPIVELIPGGSEGWANWGGQGRVASGFRYHLSIDNFGGAPEFIKDVKVTSKDDQGEPWSTTQFIFDGLEPNQMLKIEENDVKNAWVFLTDAPGQTQRLLPAIDHDIAKLIITLRSDGREITISVPPSRLQNR